MDVTKNDIIQVLEDIMKNDIPFWDLESDYYNNKHVDQKEFALECFRQAINIIKNK